MLSDKSILVVGGDRRQLEVIRKLSDCHAKVYLVGFDQQKEAFPGTEHACMSVELLKRIKVLILPAIGVSSDGRVASAFSSEEIVLTEEGFAVLAGEGLIISGTVNGYLLEHCAKHHIELVELFARDDVAILNSIPTAEGAIQMAMEHTDFTIHGSVSMVLGLGRVGLTLARTLHGLGAKVKVGVREPELYSRAMEMGLTPFYMEKLHRHVQDVDILFNTIPAMVVTADVISNMPCSSLIIDLASQPGGTDFHFAEQCGVKAILAPGLPGRVAPKTAGRIMADVICGLLGGYYCTLMVAPNGFLLVYPLLGILDLDLYRFKTAPT